MPNKTSPAVKQMTRMVREKQQTKCLLSVQFRFDGAFLMSVLFKIHHKPPA